MFRKYCINNYENKKFVVLSLVSNSVKFVLKKDILNPVVILHNIDEHNTTNTTTNNLSTTQIEQTCSIKCDHNENIGINFGITTFPNSTCRNTLMGCKSGNNLVFGDGNSLFGYKSGANIFSGTNNTAIGSYSLILADSATNNVGIGTNTLLFTITGDGNIAIGKSSGTLDSDSNDTISIGVDANSTADGSIALGKSSTVLSNSKNGISIGNEASVSWLGSIAIGGTSYDLKAASSFGVNSISIGPESLSSHNSSIAIGVGTDASENNTISIGTNAKSNENGAIVIGGGISSDYSANAFGINSIAIGNNSQTTRCSSRGISIGASSTVNHIVSVSIGSKTSCEGKTELQLEIMLLLKVIIVTRCV